MVVKYAEIKVSLEKDGNTFFILGNVKNALKKAGVSKEEICKFQKEATSGDYNNMLKICNEWITVQ